MRVPDGHTESCALERILYDQPGAGHGSRCHGSTCHPAGARDSACHEGMGESFILEPAQGFNCIHQAARSFIAKIWSMAPGLWPWWYVCAKSFQSCLTLCDPMDCSLPGSAIHGILQVRILESCPPPEDLLNPGIEPVSLISSALAGGFLTPRATWEALALVEALRKMLVTQRDAHVSAGLQFGCHFQRNPLRDSLHLRDTQTAGLFSQEARTASPWTYCEQGVIPE